MKNWLKERMIDLGVGAMYVAPIIGLITGLVWLGINHPTIFFGVMGAGCLLILTQSIGALVRNGQ
jgi:hypothetical protein